VLGVNTTAWPILNLWLILLDPDALFLSKASRRRRHYKSAWPTGTQIIHKLPHFILADRIRHLCIVPNLGHRRVSLATKSCRPPGYLPQPFPCRRRRYLASVPARMAAVAGGHCGKVRASITKDLRISLTSLRYVFDKASSRPLFIPRSDHVAHEIPSSRRG
jgi:hypothetical protein